MFHESQLDWLNCLRTEAGGSTRSLNFLCQDLYQLYPSEFASMDFEIGPFPKVAPFLGDVETACFVTELCCGGLAAAAIDLELRTGIPAAKFCL